MLETVLLVMVVVEVVASLVVTDLNRLDLVEVLVEVKVVVVAVAVVVAMVVVVVEVTVVVVDRHRLHQEAKGWTRYRSNLDLLVTVARDLLDDQSYTAASSTASN